MFEFALAWPIMCDTFCSPRLQLRYKETFELSKGHYRTVKDALDITYHRRVTDDISEVGD